MLNLKIFQNWRKKERYRFPTPPLIVVGGDTGSGKTEVLRILCHVIEHEFGETGDDPDKPYILKLHLQEKRELI